jgi:hypothetical protein
MTNLQLFSNRHIGNQVTNIKKGDWVYLENSLSKKRWSLYFDYINIDETALDLTYVTQEQFFELRGTDMKFDNIIGNAPYQMVTDGNSNPIWDRFVKKADELLKEGGYLTMVHPAGWRNVDGRFSYIRDMLLNHYQIERLEIYNVKDGQKTFGASTRYDWYVAQKIEPYKNTIVKFEDGTVEEIDLHEMPFIPNHSPEHIKSLIARNGEERVNVLYSRSAYGTDKKNTSKQQTEEFKYPVVYGVSSVDDSLVLQWSSTNKNGHFTIPKLIWSQAGTISTAGSFLDTSGEYGLTEFTYAIVDEPENLPLIKKAFDSKEFRNICDAGAINRNIIDRRTLATFRKDFWKEFV